MGREENPNGPVHEGRGPFGTALLVGSGAILLLAGFHQIGGLPFDMPRSWYQYRAVWLGLAVAGVVAGVTLLRPPRGDETDTT